MLCMCVCVLVYVYQPKMRDSAISLLRLFYYESMHHSIHNAMRIAYPHNALK